MVSRGCGVGGLGILRGSFCYLNTSHLPRNGMVNEFEIVIFVADKVRAIE